MSAWRARRRAFLKLVGGAGAAGAAATLFPWLARAGGAPGLPKLVLFYTPHGTIWDAWRPGGGELDFTLSPILSPLSAHRDRLVVVDGLSIPEPYSHRVPHTYDMPALWTGSPIDTTATDFERTDHGVTFGWNTGTSIDQTIVNRIAPATPHRTIELGVQCGGSHPNARMIYTGPREPRHPLDRPSLAWDQIFAGLAMPEPDTTPIRRRAVLDTVLADLASVRPTLSASDQSRLDAHAASLREIEGSLVAAPVSCTLPDDPVDGGLEFDIDRQIDLLTAALACGQTRVASLQVRQADNDTSLYPWVGLTTDGHHLKSHDSSAASVALLTRVYQWYAERFAHLLDRMAAIPDGDGTSLLDNTMVLWGSELGIGWVHDITNVPFIVAGGNAHGVRSGRYLRVTGQHNRLLVSAAHYMGLTDIESYGTTDDDVGPLAGLL